MAFFRRPPGRSRPAQWLLPVAAAVVGATLLAAAPRAPELRLPPDLKYDKAEGSPGPVIFSHRTHVPMADTKCVRCHPAPFKILRPTRKVTHDEMDAGRQCGICHDGTSAIGTQQDDCSHCHGSAGGGS